MADIDASKRPCLPLTGERTVPGIREENYWFRRHEAAYQALAPVCRDAAVLEAGCGEGFGGALLATVARRVLALDYDQRAVAHAAARYPRLDVLRGNLAALPIRHSAVDVVVALQVIEHLWDPDGFLVECARVLRPGGRLLLSTPNRLTFSPGRDTPLNPFHTRELAPRELSDVVCRNGFDLQQLAGLHHGPRLRALDGTHGGSLIDAQVAVVLGTGEWPDSLLADVAGVRSADFELHENDLAASLDLVAVAVLA